MTTVPVLNLADFRLVSFSVERASRGEPAANILCVVEGDESQLWLTEAEVDQCVADFGRHSALLHALQAYRGTLPAEASSIECPALHTRSPQYPFGNKAPKRLLMLRTVVGCQPSGFGFAMMGRMPNTAIAGMEVNAWTDSEGRVFAQFPDSERIELQEKDFQVIQWHTIED